MNTNTDSKIFSTRDLTMAATLVTLKFELDGIDYQILGSKNQPIGYFKFHSTPALRDAVKKYTQGLLAVEPRFFMTNVHALKADVMGAFTNPHSRIFESEE